MSFETKQDEIIDKLMDVPNITAESVFNELREYNNNADIKFSSYVLANMWNASEAVKFRMVQGKTAADFMKTA